LLCSATPEKLAPEKATPHSFVFVHSRMRLNIYLKGFTRTLFSDTLLEREKKYQTKPKHPLFFYESSYAS
jgi:hypothetical protein